MAVGAILRYAVTATVTGVALTTVGLILMIVGGAGLLLGLACTSEADVPELRASALSMTDHDAAAPW